MSFLSFKVKKKESFFIAIYGIILFVLIHFDVYSAKILTTRIYTSLYTFLEYLVFASLLFISIKSKKFKLIIALFSILFVIFQIIYYFIAKKWRLDTIPIGIETILAFIYIFFFFFEYFKSTQSEYVYNEPVFWVAVGVLIYLGSSFFFNILGNYIDQKEQSFWFVTYIAEMLKNIFLVVAIVLYARKPNENSKKNLPYLDLDFSLTDQQPY